MRTDPPATIRHIALNDNERQETLPIQGRTSASGRVYPRISRAVEKQSLVRQGMVTTREEDMRAGQTRKPGTRTPPSGPLSDQNQSRV